MVGKVIENFFGSLTHHYVYDRGFSNPLVIAPLVASKLNRTYIFQLQLEAFQSTINCCDIVVTNVFDDVLVKQVDMQ